MSATLVATATVREYLLNFILSTLQPEECDHGFCVGRALSDQPPCRAEFEASDVDPFVLVKAWLARRKPVGVEEMHHLRTEARRRPDRTDRPNASGSIAGLFAQLALRAVERILAGFRSACRYFPEKRASRTAILAHEHDLARRGCCDDSKRDTVLHDVEPLLGSVTIANVVGANVEDAPFKETPGGEELGHFFHWRELGGTAGPRLVASWMAHPRSSVATEIGWLAYFLVVFVAAVYLLVRSLVPHHFNDKIAIALAAILAGLVMIGTRAWVGQWRRD